MPVDQRLVKTTGAEAQGRDHMHYCQHRRLDHTWLLWDFDSSIDNAMSPHQYGVDDRKAEALTQ